MVIRRIRFQDDDDVCNRELQAAASRLALARDQHVLTYIGTCYHEGSLCLVSPFASGGDLKTYLQTHPDCDRATLIGQVADGLTYLHRSGLVHGKIHTRNILMDGGNAAKLCDYGISELIPDDGTTSMRPTFAREKALYCAPERHQGAALTATCDVYSFGILTFHVFSEREPMIIAYPHTIQLVAALLHGRRPDLAEIKRTDFTEDLWNLCQRCWTPDVAMRPFMVTVQLELGIRIRRPLSGHRAPLRSQRR